jgi:hypothetical protein
LSCVKGRLGQLQRCQCWLGCRVILQVLAAGFSPPTCLWCWALMLGRMLPLVHFLRIGIGRACSSWRCFFLCRGQSGVLCEEQNMAFKWRWRAEEHELLEVEVVMFFIVCISMEPMSRCSRLPTATVFCRGGAMPCGHVRMWSKAVKCMCHYDALNVCRRVGVQMSPWCAPVWSRKVVVTAYKAGVLSPWSGCISFRVALVF